MGDGLLFLLSHLKTSGCSSLCSLTLLTGIEQFESSLFTWLMEIADVAFNCSTGQEISVD
jgi:hypothetical protein